MKSNLLKMPADIQSRFEKISQEVDVILTKTFPEKIRKLMELEQDPRFDSSRIDQIYGRLDSKENKEENNVRHCKQEPVPKKRHSVRNCEVTGDGKTTSIENAFDVVMELYSLLKPELRALLYMCLKLQVWIELMMPKIEDGNNFGVGIQESLLEDIGRVQQEMGAYLEQISRYHLARGKIVSKYQRYPNVEDYLVCIREVDEKEMLNLRVICTELVNYYHTLLDLIVKNYQKITHPRSSHHESMY